MKKKEKSSPIKKRILRILKLKKLSLNKNITDSVFQPEKTLCLLLRNNYCPDYRNKRNKGQFDIISKGLLL